jgi:hypothetical protein
MIATPPPRPAAVWVSPASPGVPAQTLFEYAPGAGPLTARVKILKLVTRGKVVWQERVAADHVSVARADVTRDGHQELLVIGEGGTAGCGAKILLAWVDGAERVLYKQWNCDTQYIVRTGELIVRQAIFKATDPQCCPSFVDTTVYRWDGKRLVPHPLKRRPWRVR